MLTDSVTPGEEQAVRNERKIILVVDDEMDITLTYSMLLEIQGFEVMTASDGRQALERVAVRLPDLVMSDYMMPVMNGIELVKHLRGNARTANIPIILSSAMPPSHLDDTVTHNAFLLKPVRFEDLMATIGRLLPQE